LRGRSSLFFVTKKDPNSILVDGNGIPKEFIIKGKGMKDKVSDLDLPIGTGKRKKGRGRPKKH
jgi:hypothetical protein